MPNGSRRSPRPTLPLDKLRALLQDDPSHERLLLLWMGTIRLLQQQEDRAYRRLLTKLERHGLIGPAPAFSRVAGRLMARERLAEVAGLLGPDDPAPEVLRRLRAFAADMTPVAPRRQASCPPRALLLMAYYGARWKAQCEAATRPKRRGDSLEDRAIELVAERFGKTPETTRSLIKRTRASLPEAWRRWIAATSAETLWGVTMDSKVDLRLIKKGALKT